MKGEPTQPRRRKTGKFFRLRNREEKEGNATRWVRRTRKTSRGVAPVSTLVKKESKGKIGFSAAREVKKKGKSPSGEKKHECPAFPVGGEMGCWGLGKGEK